MNLNNLWYIDGIDIWANFGVILEEGSADFLKYPPKKASIEHDWNDSHGIEVDLDRIFLSKREGVLNFAIFAENQQDYFTKHDAFIALWTQPGTRRLELSSHNNRSYFIYYQECNNYSQVTNLKPGTFLDDYPIRHKFSMVVVEPEPNLYPSNIFLITEDGSFLIA